MLTGKKVLVIGLARSGKAAVKLLQKLNACLLYTSLVAGPVAYIGDCDKDIALLQKASVAISRGGVHNEKVQRNSCLLYTSRCV